MFSARKRTLPSPNSAWQPRGCELNGSSFGPQLLMPHGHSGGPPSGAFQLLTTCTSTPGRYSGDEGSCVGGPETPLPLSGSAQRFGAPNVPPNDPGGFTSGAANIWFVSIPTAPLMMTVC